MQSLKEKDVVQGRSKVPIQWLTKEHDHVANALGYATHNKFMRKHCQRFFDFEDSSNIALQIVPADQFVPVEGKFNVLFTMWEFLDLPQSYIEGINRADLIVVPSRFCKDLFARYTDVPIEVCWEGVEAEKYEFRKRERPSFISGEKMRFLWVGAPNPRKGYPLVVEAVKFIERLPRMELYIKTTVPQINWMQTIRNVWNRRADIFGDANKRMSFKRMLRRMPRPSLAGKVRVVGKHKNIFFDTRMLPFDELHELYHSAHCFLLPTFGEGWGLTLCEAMATGCPCIATSVTGTADFFDEQVGYPIKHTIERQNLDNYDLKTRGYVPDIKDMVAKMVRVMENYDEASRFGAKASNRIKTKFTWERSAARLDSIIRRYAPC